MLRAYGLGLKRRCLGLGCGGLMASVRYQPHSKTLNPKPKPYLKPWVLPPPVTVYVRGPIKGYMYPYYNHYPTVTGGGQYPT